MTKPRRDPAEVAALIEQRVAKGIDLVESFLDRPSSTDAFDRWLTG